MAEDTEKPTSQRRKSVFIGDDQLPTHFVNATEIDADLEGFFLTLGTSFPIVVPRDLNFDDFEEPKDHPLFRCVIPRSVMELLIESLTTLYEFQTEQIDPMSYWREKEAEAAEATSASTVSDTNNDNEDDASGESDDSFSKLAEARAILASQEEESSFASYEHLPMHFVNVVALIVDLEVFFLTLGTGSPLVITPDHDIEALEEKRVNSHPLFRCAIPREAMEYLIDSLTSLYQWQTEQINLYRASQEREK